MNLLTLVVAFGVGLTVILGGLELLGITSMGIFWVISPLIIPIIFFVFAYLFGLIYSKLG